MEMFGSNLGANSMNSEQQAYARNRAEELYTFILYSGGV